jgi:hypothetical protein
MRVERLKAIAEYIEVLVEDLADKMAIDKNGNQFAPVLISIDESEELRNIAAELREIYEIKEKKEYDG